MEPETNNMDPTALDTARQIPKWAGRYAHNRKFPYGFVRMGLFLLSIAVIGGSARLAGTAVHEGYKTAALALIAISVASAILWIWLIATRRLVPVIHLLAGRLYGPEGTASVTTGPYRSPLSKSLVGVAFALCILFTVASGFFSLIPSRYLFPMTAAYAVPFLLYRFWARRRTSPFMLLWPGLIALHAILALAGVRPFNAQISESSFLTPIVVYGALAGLASHLYSRVALRKLRNLAQPPDSENLRGGQNV
jgi:hypothetical protein